MSLSRISRITRNGSHWFLSHRPSSYGFLLSNNSHPSTPKVILTNLVLYWFSYILWHRLAHSPMELFILFHLGLFRWFFKCVGVGVELEGKNWEYCLLFFLGVVRWAAKMRKWIDRVSLDHCQSCLSKILLM